MSPAPTHTQAVCERHGYSYQKMKEDCDEYFTIHHRGETRGVSGRPRLCPAVTAAAGGWSTAWKQRLAFMPRSPALPECIPITHASCLQLGGIIYEDLNDR